MNKVRQVARALGISDTQLRNWGNEFAEYLSSSANPGKNKVRQYTEDDLSILQTIAVLRDQETPYDEIHAALNNGTRLELTPSIDDNQTDQNDRQEPQQAIELYQAFKTTIEAYERQIETKDSRINDLTDRLIDAESRAAAAEAQIESKRIGWFDRLLGRG